MGANLVYFKGSIIISEGPYNRDACIIEKGRVEVSRLDEKENKKIIAFLEKYEVIGE
jgi:CRP-like cAMP-binding protein